jgi:hypothetical protein
VKFFFFFFLVIKIKIIIYFIVQIRFHMFNVSYVVTMYPLNATKCLYP